MTPFDANHSKVMSFALDLGRLWPHHAALFDLSRLYAAAASEAQRAAIVNALLATIWWLFVGIQLYKLGRQ